MANSKPTKKVPSISTPALVTMQWLTYVFWALTSVAIVYMAAVITSYYLGLDIETSTESIAYAVAAAFILLPIAFVLDIYFSRHEGTSKSTASSGVLVVHSVIFAVTSIVSLVVAVFQLINMFLNSFSDKGVWIAVVSSLVIFVLFGILFVRTIKHNLFPQLRVVYRFLILSVVVVASIIALTGPFAREMETRQSRAMRDTVGNVTQSIRNYVDSYGKLPSNLNELVNTNFYMEATYNSAANRDQLLGYLKDGSLTYTPNIKPSETIAGSPVFYYEVCGKFDKDLTFSSVTPFVYTDYGSELNLTNVAAGTHCYKMSVTSYGAKVIR